MGARSPLATANPGYAFSAELIATLRDLGVTQFCVCPGSRSAPLAACAATTEGVRVITHVDERSAAFFALGWMRAGARARAPGVFSRLRALLGALRFGADAAAPEALAGARVQPVALVCTSGTAAANFLPAVAEASRAQLPLLVLSADRPRELRARGAPQTIDQVQLYGSHARWFCESEAPRAGAASLARARELAATAHGIATRTPRGPVHLNLPFDEPLDPAPEPLALHVVDAAGAQRSARAPGQTPLAFEPARAREASSRAPAPARVAAGGARVMRLRVPGAASEREPAPDVRAAPPPWLVKSFVATLVRAARPVIVAGEWDAPPGEVAALLQLARVLRAPLLAEPLSQFRFGAHNAEASGPGAALQNAKVLIAAGDALLRAPDFARRMAPDLVLRVGAPAVGRAQARWLEQHPQARVLAFDPERCARDPQARVDEWLHIEPAALARAALETPELQARGAELARALSGDARERDAGTAPARARQETPGEDARAREETPGEDAHARQETPGDDAHAHQETPGEDARARQATPGEEREYAHPRAPAGDANKEAREKTHAPAAGAGEDAGEARDEEGEHAVRPALRTRAHEQDGGEPRAGVHRVPAVGAHERGGDEERDASRASQAAPPGRAPQLVRANTHAAVAPDAQWLPRWRRAEARAWDAIEAVIARDARAALAANALRALVASLPDGAVLFLSNSLPLRDAETFLQPGARRLRVLANRGANGIDGVLSSALGVAAEGAPVGLALGDLAFFHDAGALFTARRLALPLRVLVLNDGGGGIFDHLPLAAHGESVRFEEVFRLAHEQSAVSVARGFGVSAKRVRRRARAKHIKAAFRRLGARRTQLVEAPLDARANLAFHRAVWEAVARAVAAADPDAAPAAAAHAAPERAR